MSGPKAARYAVVSAELERRRRLAEARDRWHRGKGELASLTGDVEAATATYGVEIRSAVRLPGVNSPRGEDPARWAASADVLRTELARARSELGEAVKKARLQRLVAIGAQVTPMMKGGDERAHEEDAGQGEPAAGQQETMSGDLERVIARLPQGASADVEAECEALVHQLREQTNQRQRQRLRDELSHLIQKEGDRVRVVESNRRRIGELMERLDGVTGEEADRMRDRLRSLPLDEEIPQYFNEIVDQVREARYAASDRAFVLEAVEKALLEMGYEVSTGFETAVPQGGALMTLPHSANHALKLREENGRLMLNVARFSDSGEGRSEDTEIEEAFCDDFDALVEALQAQGVELSVERNDPAGVTPVQRVPRPVVGRPKPRKAKKTRERKA